MRSRETVNSLLERRDRQSRKFPTSVLSVLSSAANARRASLKITQACRKYSRIHSEVAGAPCEIVLARLNGCASIRSCASASNRLRSLWEW